MPADLRDADQVRASLVQWTDGSTDAHPTPDTQPPPERPTSGRRTPPAAADHDAGDIRAWARAHGYEVSDRGRIAQSIQDAYHQAQHA
ncbi:Lsr2 family protein [Frankia sp. Ag45/Mut15]|uniref:Lsr2 family protein n=2 Tax=Frankia umida TaxID=573489 RepID=A0ABT0K1Q5_9ACTN|nr:Lsr2 family protein [Frankia umida]